MTRPNLFFVAMLISLTCALNASARIRSATAMERTGGFVIRFVVHPSDSSRNSPRDLYQDTTKKKVKEIAPARPQPKPERIDGPIEQGRPGVISHPQFPGVDNRQPPASNGGRQQPGMDRPQPQQGGGGRPQQGPPGRPGGR